MINYKAKFQNGFDITRNSKRDYETAWAIFQPGAELPDDYGFSASLELAKKAASSRANWLTKNIADCQNGYTIYTTKAVS
jgi:hypothetical protein